MIWKWEAAGSSKKQSSVKIELVLWKAGWESGRVAKLGRAEAAERSQRRAAVETTWEGLPSWNPPHYTFSEIVWNLHSKRLYFLRKGSIGEKIFGFFSIWSLPPPPASSLWSLSAPQSGALSCVQRSHPIRCHWMGWYLWTHLCGADLTCSFTERVRFLSFSFFTFSLDPLEPDLHLFKDW